MTRYRTGPIAVLLLMGVAATAFAAEDPRDRELRSLRAMVKLQQRQIAKSNETLAPFREEIKALKAQVIALKAENARLADQVKRLTLIQPVATTAPAGDNATKPPSRRLRITLDNPNDLPVQFTDLAAEIGAHGDVAVTAKVTNTDRVRLRAVIVLIQALNAEGEIFWTTEGWPIGRFEWFTSRPAISKGSDHFPAGTSFPISRGKPLKPEYSRQWNYRLKDLIAPWAANLRVVVTRVIREGEEPKPKPPAPGSVQ